MNSRTSEKPAGAEFSPAPDVQLLSNGRYHVMVTSAGGGYSRWNNLALTRWREDATCDNWGAFCFLRDAGTGDVWSAALQPTLRQADTYETVFSAGRAAFRRCDHDIETQTKIVVSPDDDVEVRRITLTNRSGDRRRIVVTSYAEIVLAPPATDSAHPAFSKLFIETEIDRDQQAILCTRRPRAPDEATPWMFHLLATQQPGTGEISCETDRDRFIGRGRTAADPQALRGNAALSGSAGPVLDPVAAIRCCVALEPGASATVDLITGIAATRAACAGLVGKYQDKACADRAIALAAKYEESILAGLHATAADAQRYCRLAGSVLYAHAALRTDAGTIAGNLQGQSGLWGYAISGDLPVVLLQVADVANLDLVRQLVRAHGYWRLLGLAADLVIVVDGEPARQTALRDAITGLIAAGGDTIRLDQPGGIFVRLAASIVDADRILLQSVARVVLSDRDGPLAEQLARRDGVAARPPHSPHPPRPPTSAAGSHAPESLAATAAWANDLLFPNGLGGFSPDGREYVISVSPDRMTPVPWVNILANPSFGTLISESGSANTWSENAQEFRLTPWANDPVSDANAEAYYLRDEESGRFWPATLLPRVPGQCRAAGGAAAPYVTRHGFGYSVFEHSEDGIESVLTVFVAIDAPVKFALLTLRNCTRRARRLSVTGYVEWVLGDEPAKTRMHVITELDAGSGAVFARNAYNTDFAGRTAFFDVTNAGKPGAIGDLRDGNVVDMAGDAAAADGAAAGSAQRSWSGDRLAFVGPNGTLGNPAGMSRPGLSGTVGAALDPCAAIRIPCGLAAGQTCEIVFRLGAEHSAGAARDLLQRSHGAGAAHEALASVKHYWQRTLGAVQVRTPDPSLDVLANGWLVYQVLASRLWARNALYQSSGAFGFRDQLQDVMALVHAAPALVREHLLRSAGRQFPEGDVQHWWHPPSGRGVRTHCSDDYLWLPLATCRYVRCTGDTGVLDESLHFIHGSAPKAGEESSYGPATGSPEVADLYGHCVRAIGHGLVFGAHGLPLMGSCDWNDGMNLVGAGGKGESVWLGFFLYTVLTQFGELAQRRGDAAFATRCASEGARLREAIEHCAWDGDWYLRAWFDDGSPLGSAKNTECRIDSIAQSWSVLSGAGAAERACQAMVALDRHLVCPDGALIQLLDPPFDKSEPNPGYIKGYLPGVRENGGQYTHAAVWAAMAFAELGDAERAWKLFAMLNPVNHANSAESIAVYKTEPYVIAADVYSRAPHVGRGGWTWYTGSAGWMYRFILEALLGLRREADALHFAPCLPADWTSFEVHYRYRETVYHIVVLQTGRGDAGTKLTVDGLEQSRPVVPLVDDRRPHTVELIIRRQSRPGQER